MTVAKSIKQITKAINNANITVSRVYGDGYCLLTFDDGEVYETRSVMVPRLSDLSVEEWKAEAEQLIKEVTK